MKPHPPFLARFVAGFGKFLYFVVVTKSGKSGIGLVAVPSQRGSFPALRSVRSANKHWSKVFKGGHRENFLNWHYI